MREILFFLDSSLMQQMLLNESTILGSARSNPHGLLHHTLRSSRTCAPISPNPSRAESYVPNVIIECAITSQRIIFYGD